MFPGLSFRETLSGSYWLLDEPTDERAIELSLEIYTPDLRRFATNKTWRLRGTLDADRLASRSAVRGTILFKLFDERRLPYRLAFTGDDGKRYELSGQKEWSGLAPVESITLLPASLYDEAGEELGRATLRFDLRSDWARWMKSFRIRLFPQGPRDGAPSPE
jgi:hypothetical protein